MAVILPKPNPPPPNVVQPPPQPGQTTGTAGTGVKVVYPPAGSGGTVQPVPPSGVTPVQVQDLNRRVTEYNAAAAAYERNLAAFNARWAPFINASTFTGSADQYQAYRRELAGVQTQEVGLRIDANEISIRRKQAVSSGKLISEADIASGNYVKVGSSYVLKSEWDSLAPKYQAIAQVRGLDAMATQVAADERAYNKALSDVARYKVAGSDQYRLGEAVTDAAFHPELRDSIRLLFSDDQIAAAQKGAHYDWSDVKPAAPTPAAPAGQAKPQQNILERIANFGPLQRLHPEGQYHGPGGIGGRFTYTDDSGVKRTVAMGDAPLVGTASAGQVARVVVAALGALGVYQTAKQAQQAGVVDQLRTAIQEFRDKHGRNPSAAEVIVQDSAGNVATLSQIAAMKLSPSKGVVIGDMPESGIKSAIPAFPLAPEGSPKYTTFPLAQEGGSRYTVFPLPREDSGMRADLAPAEGLRPGIIVSTAGTLPRVTTIPINWNSLIAGSVGAATTKARPQIENLQIREDQIGAYRGITAATLVALDEKIAEQYNRGEITADQLEEYKKARVRYLNRKGLSAQSLDQQITDAPKTVNYRQIATAGLTQPKVRTTLRQMTGVETQTQTETETKAQTRLQEAARQREATQTRTRTATQTAEQEQTQPATQTRVVTREATRTGDATRPIELTKEAELAITDTMTGRLKLPEKDVTQTSEAPSEQETRGAAAFVAGLGWWYLWRRGGKLVRYFHPHEKPLPGTVNVKHGEGAAYRSVQDPTGGGDLEGTMNMGVVNVKLSQPKRAPGEEGSIRFTRRPVISGGRGRRIPR